MLISCPGVMFWNKFTNGGSATFSWSYTTFLWAHQLWQPAVMHTFDLKYSESVHAAVGKDYIYWLNLTGWTTAVSLKRPPSLRTLSSESTMLNPGCHILWRLITLNTTGTATLDSSIFAPNHIINMKLESGNMVQTLGLWRSKAKGLLIETV